MNRTQLLLPAILILFFGCQPSGPELVSFNRDIRPILNDKCLRCHGGVKANGGFSLLFEEDAYGETESGRPAIVPGDHRKSELYRRLVHEDPEMRMPYEARPLGEEEIELIARWIDQGAEWEDHWAYVPPDRNIQPPKIGDPDWARTPVDPFVFAKMEEKGLSPAPEADKPELLRRLSFDLTGLPPTPAEARAFLADERPDAYERLVDRLLASPHFGERWATLWLDLARYADTKGYEKDSNRSIWKYRDWVINAFNEDKPFDEFTIEQLAGDLLPKPTQPQLIATAFHRNTIANDEGGTDDEEFRVASVIERVGTTYEVWQATTMACVQCHSHPYDPFRQEDFYRSMAFFNNAIDRDIYNEQPKLFTYSEADAEKVEEIINWINERLQPEDRPPKERFLHDQKEALLYHLGRRVVEAEEYAASSPLIELIWPDLDMLWQIQDSSWIRFEEVDLTGVEAIGFRAASVLQRAGAISVHLDDVNGEKIGEVAITKTGDWNGWQGRKPAEEKLWREFKTAIKPIEGKHDLYFRFWMGDTYIQHLFYLDKITYYERSPRKAQYDRLLEQKLEELAAIPAFTTPIIQDLPPDKARKTHLLERGSWLMPGKEMPVGLPEIYRNQLEESPTDRLDFARWLVSSENSLTARVMVNRFWAELFGYGLVETMEEFGSQGTAPTHPALLDWLAVQFIEEYGWSMKSLIRQLVLSATYRQAAVVDSVKLELDPRNQYLSRGPRTRLSAEQIRDQILAVSGLLDRTVGGPSVILRELNIGESNIPSWAIRGEDGPYRRTLYTFWKRTDPFADMITFDSPDRMVCTSRRVRTNTPLQALNLLNDEVYFEASRALAREMKRSATEVEEQLRDGYRRVMVEEIDEARLNLLRELYEESLAYYRSGQAEAVFMSNAENGESESREQLAALTMVANVLLNLDAFVVK